MSFMKRILQNLVTPIRYVGRDIEGNRFYEHPSSSNDSRRTKRTVRYSDPEDVWKYIGGGKRLPVQWSAWLTHTRLNPPTLEELQADMARQRRVKANVTLIEARDQKERSQMPRLEATPTPVSDHGVQVTLTPEPRKKPLEESWQTTDDARRPSSTPQQAVELGKALPKAETTDSFKPQLWAPRTRTRGNNN